MMLLSNAYPTLLLGFAQASGCGDTTSNQSNYLRGTAYRIENDDPRDTADRLHPCLCASAHFPASHQNTLIFSMDFFSL